MPDVSDVNYDENKSVINWRYEGHNQSLELKSVDQFVLDQGNGFILVLTGTDSVPAPQGNYYSGSPSTTPEELGISPNGFNRSTKAIEPKVQHVYVTNTKVKALKSTAASVEDFWSVKGQVFHAPGGGKQLFAPNKSAFSSK